MTKTEWRKAVQKQWDDFYDRQWKLGEMPIEQQQHSQAWMKLWEWHEGELVRLWKLKPKK